jgi:cytochrome c553
MGRIVLVLALAVAGCGKNESPPPASNGVHIAQESGPKGGGTPPGHPGGGGGDTTASRLFMTVCATCHGADGTGTGPAAETLNPKPRNYTDPKWQASVTDADIKAIIVKGGQAVGKSAMMPANPTLDGDNATLDGLVQIIRGFGKKQ